MKQAKIDQLKMQSQLKQNKYMNASQELVNNSSDVFYTKAAVAADVTPKS